MSTDSRVLARSSVLARTLFGTGVTATDPHSRNFAQMSVQLMGLSALPGTFRPSSSQRRPSRATISTRPGGSSSFQSRAGSLIRLILLPIPSTSASAKTRVGKIRYAHALANYGDRHEEREAELGIRQCRRSAAFFQRLTHKVVIVSHMQANFALIYNIYVQKLNSS